MVLEFNILNFDIYLLNIMYIAFEGSRGRRIGIVLKYMIY